jgi:hypothetical protein
LKSSGVFLDRARIAGAFLLHGAIIEGQFAAEGAIFENPSGAAIDATSSSIRAFILRSTVARQGAPPIPTRVRGEVRLTRACIQHHLEISGTHVKASYSLAFRGRALEVRGNFLIGDGAIIDGGVLLTLADLKGHLDLRGARISAAGIARREGALAGSPEALEALDSSKWSWHALDASEAKIAQLTMPETAETRPRGIVDLSRARVGTYIDFAAAWPDHARRKGRDCPTRLVDDHGREADHLVLDGFEYEHLDNPDGLRPGNPGIAKARLDWLHAQSCEDLFGRLRLQPWRQLAKVLALQGYGEEARFIAIERRVAQRHACGMRKFALFMSWLLHHLADYGFNPWKTMRWSVCVIALCALFYAAVAWTWCDRKPLCGDERVFVRTLASDFVPAMDKKEDVALKLYRTYPSFDPLLYSVDLFLPLLDAGVERFWRANSRTWLGTVLFVITILEQILGAILVSLIVTGFTGLLTRDEA